MRYSFFPILLSVTITLWYPGAGRPGGVSRLPAPWTFPARPCTGSACLSRTLPSVSSRWRRRIRAALNNKPLAGFLVRFQVRHGLGVMPSFDEERVTEEELDLLVEYLAALRRSN